jgi:hypothetical protein
MAAAVETKALEFEAILNAVLGTKSLEIGLFVLDDRNAGARNLVVLKNAVNFFVNFGI